ncbi:MAG: ABC transporter permease [Bacillota bacterium]|nr:ABC transporter permease [Bacillota bacterium]
MNLSMTIRLAWKNILGNRLRSALTILGLVIGIASVILLVGLVNGAAQSVNDEIASMGADVITVEIYDETTLDLDDMDAMSKLNSVRDASPELMLDAALSKGGEKSSGTTLIGAGESYIDIMGYEIGSGRNISRIDVGNSTKAVVIGSGIARRFWKQKDPCGDTIKIEGDDYTVIGVLQSAGSAMGNNVDEMVIMPITAAKYLGESIEITFAYVRADTEEDADAACTSVRDYLTNTKHMDPDSCIVVTQKMMLKTMEEINRTMSLLLGGIASISLLVGGIGVMNVMLVSVTERTREIGIRKSLGARRKDIMYQFLIESVVLSAFGGIVGILLGLVLGRIASLTGMMFAPGIGMIMLAVGVSVAVGIIFGILPSYRAACLKPVEALRYE